MTLEDALRLALATACGLAGGFFVGMSKKAGQIAADKAHKSISEVADRVAAAKQKRDTTPSLLSSVGAVTAAARPLIDELDREYMELGRPEDTFFARAIESFKGFDDEQIRSLFHIASVVATAHRKCGSVTLTHEGPFAVASIKDQMLKMGEIPIETRMARDVIDTLSTSLSQRGERKPGTCEVSVEVMRRIDVALRAAKLPKPELPGHIPPIPPPKYHR